MNKFGLILGKKGDKLLTVYWFAILILVSGGIIGMVNTFYNHPYDIRTVEADILSNKIVRCFESGNFNLNFETSILDKCNLNFNIQEGEEIEYYLSVKFYSDLDGTNLINSFEEGNKNLISSCEIKDEEYQKLAKCSEKEFYSLDNENQGYLIKILGIVRKGEQNVK